MRLKTFLAIVAMLLLSGSTLVPATAQTPAASPATPTGELDLRQLDVKGRGLALSPDGQWLAGVGPDQTPCFWDVETLTPQCADEELPVLVHPSFPSMAWAPDSSAVAFSLDAIMRLEDSDIYLFERERGALTNLTDDGYEGGLMSAPDGTQIDIVPTWSPDGQQIVFSRSVMEDMTSSTTVMRIDRAGGEPVEIASPDIEEPMTIWMPMHWLHDDTIVYSVVSTRVDEPLNGVWRVGVDGTDPEKLIPGHASSDIPAGVAADVNPESGAMSVYSPLLLGQFSTEWDLPIFWLGDLDDGAVRPLPFYDAEQGVALEPASIPPTDMYAYPLLMFPASPAALSPDGASALVVYRTMNSESSLAMVNIDTGEFSMFESLPPDVQIQPLAPQWVDNGTVLLLTAGGPLLLTLEPAA